jgi:glucan phosphoethanolaminetransferase (alkaline phosphatase superfamily)
MNSSDLRNIKTSSSSSASKNKLLFLLGIKCLLLVALLGFTNQGFLGRVELLLINHRPETLVPYVAIWAIALFSLVIAAFQPDRWLRWVWAALLALSTAIGWGYQQASQSELTAFDILSLWNARHEAGRAGEEYAHVVWMGLALFVFAFAVFAVNPVIWGPRAKLWLRRFAWLPAVPVLAIGSIVYLKGGGGSQAMPQQFAPLALSAVTSVRIALNPPQPRTQVSWLPDAARRQEKILVLVDESIRADYAGTTPEHVLTPNMVASASQLIDYGRAISGGNCSHYSNAILRFMVDRDDIIHSANTNPTVWDYARKAGYRTVFIDAQAGSIRTASALQNFMTLEEKAKIDSFHALQNVEASDADDRLMAIVAEELAKPGPVFIYANKNGAHFPYDEAYDAKAATFHPTVKEAGETFAARANSYMNAIRWSVDRLWPQLMRTVTQNSATLVYTSDHGQIVEPVGLTHCHVTDPETRTALVPLMLHLPDSNLQKEYAAAAPIIRDHASHFMLPATLLDFMGYARADTRKIYNMSLLNAGQLPLAFTSGDIFGLMSNDVSVNEADPMKVAKEPEAQKALDSLSRSASVQ